MSTTSPVAELGRQRWLRLLPVAFVTYSLAYLDRSNFSIGVAGGLKEDLALSGAMSSLIGASFFLGYCAFQIPGTLYAERRSVRGLIFWCTLAWGALATAQGLLHSGAALLVVRWVRLRDDRLLLVLGGVVACALQAKYLIAVFCAAVLCGALLFGPAALLRRPKLWLGAGAAGAACVPSVLWQARHGWPQLEMREVVAAENWWGPAYVPVALLCAGIAGAGLLCLGTWALLRSPELRFLGWTFLGVTAAFVVGNGRPYYVAGFFGLLFADDVQSDLVRFIGVARPVDLPSALGEVLLELFEQFGQACHDVLFDLGSGRAEELPIRQFPDDLGTLVADRVRRETEVRPQLFVLELSAGEGRERLFGGDIARTVKDLGHPQLCDGHAYFPPVVVVIATGPETSSGLSLVLARISAKCRVVTSEPLRDRAPPMFIKQETSPPVHISAPVDSMFLTLSAVMAPEVSAFLNEKVPPKPQH